MEWVGGEIAAKCRLCRCKISNLVREETGTSILFYLPWPSGSPDPFSPPGLLCSDPYSAFTSARFCSPTLLCSDLRFPEIAGCLEPFSASEIMSDAHPVASAAGLQTHLRILALSLTEHRRLYIYVFRLACTRASILAYITVGTSSAGLSCLFAKTRHNYNDHYRSRWNNEPKWCGWL